MLPADRRFDLDGAAALAAPRFRLVVRVVVLVLCCGAFAARGFFFDTFFRLVFLADFTVFLDVFFDVFFDPFFDPFFEVLFDVFFAVFFCFFDDEAFFRLDFDGRRALGRAEGFLATFFLLRRLLFLAAALFAGIRGLQDDSNETGDYTYGPRLRKYPVGKRMGAQGGGSCTAGDGVQPGLACSATTVV